MSFNPFETIWTFIGTVIIIQVILEGVGVIVAAWRKRTDE